MIRICSKNPPFLIHFNAYQPWGIFFLYRREDLANSQRLNPCLTLKSLDSIMTYCYFALNILEFNHIMKIYTIGYEGIDINRFMKCMEFFKVTKLIDVREVTLSRKKDFSKNALHDLLMEHGIDYISIKELGTPKKLREKLRTTGNYEGFFEEYRSYLKDKEHLLLEILNLINDNQTVALMCYEKDHNKCHRKIIAEEIQRIDNNGLQILQMLVK